MSDNVADLVRASGGLSLQYRASEAYFDETTKTKTNNFDISRTRRRLLVLLFGASDGMLGFSCCSSGPFLRCISTMSLLDPASEQV